MHNLPEVGLLSQRTMPLLSTRLQDGLCFLQLPMPAGLSARLAANLPSARKEANGFTMFCIPNRMGLVPGSTPAARDDPCVPKAPGSNLAACLLAKPDST